MLYRHVSYLVQHYCRVHETCTVPPCRGMHMHYDVRGRREGYVTHCTALVVHLGIFVYIIYYDDHYLQASAARTNSDELFFSRKYQVYFEVDLCTTD